MKWNLAMLHYRDKAWDMQRNLLGYFKLFPKIFVIIEIFVTMFGWDR